MPPLSVLLIDDDELSREVIELHLVAAGHNPLLAENGNAALALLEALPTPPDLLLTDLHMPGPTGTALLALLHPHLRPDTPAIAMSASQPAPDAVAGYHAFLLKPFSEEELDQAIVTAQHNATDLPSSITPEVPLTMLSIQPHPPASASPTVLPSIHAATPESPLALDPVVFEQLLEMLRVEQLVELFHLSFRELDKHLQRMRVALEDNDPDTLHHSAHTVKGSFAIVGAHEIQHLGARLEALSASPADARATLAQFPLAIARLRGMLGTRGVHLEQHPSPGQEFA